MTTMSSFTEVRLSRPIGCRVMVEKKTSTRFSYGQRPECHSCGRAALGHLSYTARSRTLIVPFDVV